MTGSDPVKTGRRETLRRVGKRYSSTTLRSASFAQDVRREVHLQFNKPVVTEPLVRDFDVEVCAHTEKTVLGKSQDQKYSTSQRTLPDTCVHTARSSPRCQWSRPDHEWALTDLGSEC